MAMPLVAVLLISLLMSSSSHKTTIFIIGDSTAAEKGNYRNYPERGWGMVFQGCFDDQIIVDNHAVNGRSSKSFLDEGRWQKVLDKIQPGDYVIIQFGHNDEKINDPTRYASPEQFAANLLAYARAAQAKGALPVLITPLVRRHFEGDTLTPTHGAYPDAVRALASRENLPLIDLTAASARLVQRLGEPASRELYMVFAPNLYPNYPEGKTDNTHLRYAGAVKFTGLVADGLQTLGGAYAQVLLAAPEKDKYDEKGYEG